MFFSKKNKIIDELKQENKTLFSIITTKLSIIITKQISMITTLKNLQDQLAFLQQSVAKEDTVIDSAVQLITGFSGIIGDLKQQLADALALNDQAALQQVVANMEQLKMDVDSKAQSLAGAVAANTTADTTGNANTSAGSDASNTSTDQTGDDGTASGDESPGSQGNADESTSNDESVTS